jgi:hypothetical protein
MLCIMPGCWTGEARVVQLRGCRSQTGLQGLLIFCGLRNRAPQPLRLGTHKGINWWVKSRGKLQHANQFLDVGGSRSPPGFVIPGARLISIRTGSCKYRIPLITSPDAGGSGNATGFAYRLP